jgi:hypothetical protein
VDRDGLHSGTAGLAHVLAEIRLTRAWTAEEQRLAAGIADRLQRSVPTLVDCTYWDGLVSATGALIALQVSGADLAIARLAALAEPDGWPQTVLTGPSYAPGTRINDLTLGTAGVLLGALWARRHGVVGAAEVAAQAAGVLLDEAEHLPTGSSWQMVSPRFGSSARNAEMPNLAHGLAGVATALALAGAELDRPDLAAAARRGAEHLVSLGDTSGDGFVVPRYLPRGFNDEDEVAYGWCHGATGTSLLFLALDRAGVPEVAGRGPLS